jgi:hypothetical protein
MCLTQTGNGFSMENPETGHFLHACNCAMDTVPRHESPPHPCFLSLKQRAPLLLSSHIRVLGPPIFVP